MALEGCLSVSDWQAQWSVLTHYPLKRIHVDVGCYRGRFLSHLAMMCPDEHVVGVEINSEYADAANELCLGLGLENVSIVCGDALMFFRDATPQSVISEVHIYFPTPYPRAIGQRHRLVSAAFIDAVHQALLPGGSLRVLTDEVNYFGEIESLFSPMRWWSSIWQPMSVGQPTGFLAGTSSEARYRGEGRTIWALQALK
ncbi:tRNA (guanine(46)-N(7))-methyltransferase TrmB [Paludibaculum fermentans]|uniref:tRNA (guanine(46)-N(7))-methyltransferase TrmB n=1 Tax=Paludibaculum fermentans TaxID=1473598 RepID=UPI003EBA16AE